MLVARRGSRPGRARAARAPRCARRASAASVRRPPATTVEHDVVDRAAERVLDELEVGELAAHERRAAGAGRSSTLSGVSGAGFSARPRDLADALERLARRVQRRRSGGARRRRARPASSNGSSRERRATPRAASCERARLGLRRPRLALVRQRPAAPARGRTARSRGRRRRCRRRARGGSWRSARSGRPRAPARATVSHSGLARSSRCEWMRAASARSCSSEPGRRQRGVAHVVLEVEARVVDPQRPAGLERRERELLAVARDEVQPRRGCGRRSRRTPAAGPRRSSPRRRACGAFGLSCARNEASTAVSRSPCACAMSLREPYSVRAARRRARRHGPRRARRGEHALVARRLRTSRGEQRPAGEVADGDDRHERAPPAPASGTAPVGRSPHSASDADHARARGSTTGQRVAHLRRRRARGPSR